MMRPALSVGDLDRGALVRLAGLAVDLLDEDGRLADGELVALAPHVLDQDAQVHHAAALDLDRLAAGRVDELERHVAQGGLLEPARRWRLVT